MGNWKAISLLFPIVLASPHDTNATLLFGAQSSLTLGPSMLTSG